MQLRQGFARLQWRQYRDYRDIVSDLIAHMDGDPNAVKLAMTEKAANLIGATIEFPSIVFGR
jgi:hypothetical protein